ncbi:hypothetical protein HJFPF1_03502 [Paramyrothecium foliicola]|nr:hypothetical protein HJFPF1_03502 [Paramyrothecium foliicola]
MSVTKIETSTSNFEVDFTDSHPRQRLVNLLESARAALTVLALASAITIVGLSADALAVYNRTHVPIDLLLPLWPERFDIRPTTALVATSTIIAVVTAISLLASKMPSLRRNTVISSVSCLGAPLIGFVLAFIAMAFFYGVNASDTVETFQSWTCRWQGVAMRSEPHFGTLCKQSRAGLGLAVALVPLEAVILGLAAYQIILERKMDRTSTGRGQKAASPALSREQSRLPQPSLDPVVEGQAVQVVANNPSIRGAAASAKPQPGRLLSKQRSRFFQEGAPKKNDGTAEFGDKILHQAMLLAEVQTNVIVNDEFTFTTELSHHLAARYDRTVCSILVTVQHGICMLYGGSFDPAYSVVISTLPCQVQATTNKRNTSLLQKHMEQALGVPAARGLVRYIPVPEECFGKDGRTVAASIDDPSGSKLSEPRVDKAEQSSMSLSESLQPEAVIAPDTGSFSGRGSAKHLNTDRDPAQQSARYSNTTDRTGPAGTPAKRVRNKKSLMQLIFQTSTPSDEGKARN